MVEAVINSPQPRSDPDVVQQLLLRLSLSTDRDNLFQCHKTREHRSHCSIEKYSGYMTRPFFIAAVAALCGSVAGSTATAQPAVPTPESQNRPRFSIAARFGHPSDGPAAGIEDAMRAAGLNQPSSGLSGRDYIEHPFSATGFASIGFPISLDARYRVTGPWVVGALYSHTPIGETLGHREPLQYLFIDYRVTSVAALVGAGWRVFEVGVGPALHRASAWRNDPELTPQSRTNQWLLGYVFQSRTAVPTGSAMFFDASFEYRSVGRAVVGPYNVEGTFDSSTTFPRANVSFNHWLVGVGAGLRF